MKNVSIITCLLFCFCSVEAQKDSNFICFHGNLKEYKIADCLIDLLTEVVALDSGHIKFPSDRFYYELTFKDHGGYRDLTVLPSRWDKSMTLDFEGFLKIDGMYFLCRGDISKGQIFQQTGRKMMVRLKSPRLYQYDSIDARIESYTWQPTLAGRYSFCAGTSIDLYILVGGKLSGYGLRNQEEE